MKTRKRKFGPAPRGPHKNASSGNRFGGRERSHHGPKAPARPAPERPTKFVVQALREGAYLRARVLQRDLVNIDFELVEQDFAIAHGDFVEAEPESNSSKRLVALKPVPSAQAATWAAICNHALRVEWPAEVETEAHKLPAYTWKDSDKRADWRKLSIVTIDGADARDFDDAVWAEEWLEGKNVVGHHILVAIADVAHYVQPGSPLDREALLRGNSTYFPDKVLPMLPERLSNDLCSLRPHEDRPVLGVEMWIDLNGRLRKHSFRRGCIHSAARLTYEQVQDIFDGTRNPRNQEPGVTEAVREGLLRLRAAYAVLAEAREKRGALDLDIPEVKLEVKDGKIVKVGTRLRLEAHRLIEELMILANVAAAETLSRKGSGLYRIHPEPTKEKLETLRASLAPLGFTVPAPHGGPKAWAKLVAQVNGHPAAQTLLRSILQSQQQAKYDPANIGHYGLALPLYSHFTSPIRRYADLVVHRALLAALQSKPKGDEEPEAMVARVEGLGRVAEQINATERKSQMAEWESRDRLVAQHFAELVGKPFTGVVISVVPFGCFIAVDGVAEGLLPKWDLGRDWVYVASMSCWRKQSRGKGLLRVGTKVDVVLREADPLGGRLTFGLNDGAKPVFVEERPRSFKEDGTPVAPKPERVRSERTYGKKPKQAKRGTTMGHPLGRAKKGNMGGTKGKK